MLDKSSKKPLSHSTELNKGTASFADNVLALAVGSAIALGISILASPITSRLFGPQEFGLAALFMSGAIILGSIACLRYEMAIVLPKEDKDAASLFVLCSMILIVTTTLTATFSLLLGPRILSYLGADELKPYLWLFPIYVILIGMQFLLRIWHTRYRRFRITAATNVLSSLLTAVAEISGGWAGFTTGGNLVVIRFFSLFGSPAFLLWRLLRIDYRFIIRNINLGPILKSANKYIKFPLIGSLTAIVTALASHLPIMLLAALFNPVVSGFYAKALYLLLLPASIIGKSIGQVFFQESADQMADGRNLAGLVETVISRGITFGFLPFALLAIIGPELFGLFLGARWTESGVYVQILSPQLYLSLVAVSITTLFGTLGKQELDLLSQGLGLILRTGILIYGGLLWHDARLTLIAFTAANILILLWRVSILFRIVKLSAKRPLSHFLRSLFYAMPSITLSAAMKWWFGLEAVYLVALTPICAIPYVLFVLRHDPELRALLIKNIRRVCTFV
jgi:lipopolysaccharide exporter